MTKLCRVTAVAGPMPLTCSSSSVDLNGPFEVRWLMTALARSNPIRGSAASCSTLAVLMLTRLVSSGAPATSASGDGGNDDGFITDADAIWPQLRIWVDADANGIATYAEMRTLKSYGITAIETIPKRHRYIDPAGNLIPLWAWALQSSKPGRALMVDVA